MYDLKPCPFCGGDAEFQQTAYGTTEGNSVKLTFQVKCKKCSTTAPKSYGSVSINFMRDGLLNIWHDDREQAVKEWNRRAEAESHIALVEKLNKRIEELELHYCPHAIRNVHDRGDDSLCRVLGAEPTKEGT